ncbi:MAG TPA: hypothetical protein VGM06_19060 [Polyangiaceae bacterium]
MPKTNTRILVYVGAALAVLALGHVLPRKAVGCAGETASDAPGHDLKDTQPSSRSPQSPRLRRPPASTALFGVLTDRPENEVRALAERGAVQALLTPDLCGDPPSCDAVRSVLEDEHATTLDVKPVSEWSFGLRDADASAKRLPSADRAGLGRRSRVLSVRVSMATSARQLALRTAIAVAAAVAKKLDGLVDDPLLARIETWRGFASHAVTESLETSTFRRDRIEVIVEPREDGIVRLVTAGLARWGAPDVEAARVPVVAEEAVTALVLGVAAAVTAGADAGPCVLSLDDLGRARGEAYPADAGLPPSAAIPIELVSVQAETGDANDFVARISPPAGEGPLAYLELAERFFGPILAGSSAAERDRRDLAQGRLAAALARWTAEQPRGPRLAVALPFAIPGDAGVESMWIEVTRYDATSVGGILLDEPLGATDHAPGEAVLRPRSEVLDLRWSRSGDGGGAVDR